MMRRKDIVPQYSYNGAQALNQTKRADVDQLNQHMQTIVNHLTTLRYYLNHQGAYVMDEVADWFREANLGKGTEYRHSRIEH